MPFQYESVYSAALYLLFQKKIPNSLTCEKYANHHASAKDNVMHHQWINGAAMYFFGLYKLKFSTMFFYVFCSKTPAVDGRSAGGARGLMSTVSLFYPKKSHVTGASGVNIELMFDWPGPDYIRVSFYRHIKYDLSDMLKIKRGIDQQDFKIVHLHFVKSE